MPTLDPKRLAREMRLLFDLMGLELTARVTPALRFRESVELGDGRREARIVEAPAVLVGDKIAIRVERDYYRVYNLAATPYHGLFHQGVCKTKNVRYAIQAAVMAAVHEHFTGLFEEYFPVLVDDEFPKNLD